MIIAHFEHLNLYCLPRLEAVTIKKKSEFSCLRYTASLLWGEPSVASTVQDQGVHNLFISPQAQKSAWHTFDIYKWQLALKDAFKLQMVYKAVLMKLCMYTGPTFS